MGNEVVICFAEMFTAEEAGGDGEGRGVRGFEYQMFAAVDVRTLRFCIIAPEHKNETLTFFRERADDRIGKLFPPFFLVRAGRVRANS